MVPGIVMNCALNFFWIPAYGGRGAAMASCVSYTFSLLVFVFFYRRFTGIGATTLFAYRRSDFDVVMQRLKGLRPARARHERLD
jgi:Na+-driven multidrug efflux pump